MAKRRMGLMLVLLALLGCLLPSGALVASASQVREPIDTNQEASLTISYRYDGTGFANQTVMLYHIAEVSADFQYTLTPDFAPTGLILNGIQTNGEWNVIRSTLEAYIPAHAIQPVATAVTDENGQACFTGLKPGLYLATEVQMIRENMTCVFAAALVAVPGLTEEGLWQYQVVVAAKPEILPPIEPDEKIEFKLLKLWKGDREDNRPERIEVEIYRDGVLMETVILSEENYWSYSWSAPADGATWTVLERNVPEGYTMTVENREFAFVVTNTWPPEEPEDPGPPPQTGDRYHVLRYTVMLYASGITLILLGITGKRKRHEETT